MINFSVQGLKVPRGMYDILSQMYKTNTGKEINRDASFHKHKSI